jgi:hypothetical protein
MWMGKVKTVTLFFSNPHVFTIKFGAGAAYLGLMQHLPFGPAFPLIFAVLLLPDPGPTSEIGSGTLS